MDNAIKEVEKARKSKVKLREYINGTFVGITLKNGEYWALASRSFYKGAPIIFERVS